MTALFARNWQQTFSTCTVFRSMGVGRLTVSRQHSRQQHPSYSLTSCAAYVLVHMHCKRTTSNYYSCCSTSRRQSSDRSKIRAVYSHYGGCQLQHRPWHAECCSRWPPGPTWPSHSVAPLLLALPAMLIMRPAALQPTVAYNAVHCALRTDHSKPQRIKAETRQPPVRQSHHSSHQALLLVRAAAAYCSSSSRLLGPCKLPPPPGQGHSWLGGTAAQNAS
jgi:hypothetical protein